jgi:hypothetical protein
MKLSHPHNYIHKKLERLSTMEHPNGEPIKNEFSPYRCECCNDLAGERFSVKAFYWDKHAKNGTRKLRSTYEVCFQCVYDWQ